MLNYKEVTTIEGEKVKIIKLRNPWGGFEWKGDWSDYSECWTEEAKQICDLKQADDGIFWMNFADFKENFISLHICKYYPHFKFHYKIKQETYTINDEIEQKNKQKADESDTKRNFNSSAFHIFSFKT